MGKTEHGHTVGTSTSDRHARSGDQQGPVVTITSVPLVPRLLDLHAAASYLGISEWTVRTLEQQGILRRIRIPLQGHAELRKLLFDKSDLDRLIECWKDGAAQPTA